MSTRLRWIIFGLAVAAVASSALVACRKSNQALEPVRLATVRNELSSLIYVAHAMGFFRDRGLELQISERQVGSDSVEELVHGRVDFATAGDFSLAQAAFARPELRVLARISKADIWGLIGRADQGISTPEDVRGKRIGLRLGSNAEYFLSRFLLFNGVQGNEVILVNLEIPASKESLVAGSVDAVFVFEPHIGELRNVLGANAVVFPGQEGQEFFWLLLSTEPVLHQRPGTALRFVEALAMAEDLFRRDEASARKTAAKSLGVAETAPDRYALGLGLHQPLILTLEEEARWLLRTHGEDGDIPNFLRFLYPDALEAAKPETYTVFRWGAP